MLPVNQIVEFLEFLANEKNWQSPSKGFAAQYDPEPAPVYKNGYARKKAQEMLDMARTIDSGSYCNTAKELIDAMKEA